MDMSAISSEELTLLCVDAGEAAAWTEFVRRFQKPIALTVLRISRRWGLAALSTVDDLVQDTYVRLCADRCRLLRDFKTGPSGSDSLVALVRVVASNVAHDYFRSKTAQKRGGIQTGAPPWPLPQRLPPRRSAYRLVLSPDTTYNGES
jgi:RNA polymerase sigma-70 factor (ECF subfamily)